MKNRECAEPASPGRCMAPRWGEARRGALRGASISKNNN